MPGAPAPSRRVASFLSVDVDGAREAPQVGSRETFDFLGSKARPSAFLPILPQLVESSTWLLLHVEPPCMTIDLLEFALLPEIFAN